MDFSERAIYNIGVGSADPRVVRDLRIHLAELIAERKVPIAGSAHVYGHRIPVWTHPEPPHRGNVILVGDAAGHCFGLRAKAFATRWVSMLALR